jgi:hypothetical protein
MRNAGNTLPPRVSPDGRRQPGGFARMHDHRRSTRTPCGGLHLACACAYSRRKRSQAPPFNFPSSTSRYPMNAIRALASLAQTRTCICDARRQVRANTRECVHFACIHEPAYSPCARTHRRTGCSGWSGRWRRGRTRLALSRSRKSSERCGLPARCMYRRSCALLVFYCREKLPKK